MYNYRTINNVQRRSERLPLDQLLFLAGVFAKQFYLLPSGSIQLGDILMVLGAIWCYLIRKKGHMAISKNELPFFLYIFAVALINSVYALTQGTFSYMKSTMYYAFNVVIMLVFIDYIRDGAASVAFLNKLRKVLQAAMLLQLAAYLLNLGRWYGGSRYEGTFNDPNQYGVFVLFAFFIIYMIGQMLKQRNWPWMVMALVLIIPSSSVGTLGGLCCFYIIVFLFSLYRGDKKTFLIWLVVVVAITIVVFLLLTGTLELPDSVTETKMYKRILEKCKEFLADSGSQSLVTDRGWKRVFEHPKYLLFGAGEGGSDRFGSGAEVHSSILGPLFSYGIIPFTMLVIWCSGKLRRLDVRFWGVYIGLLCESLFLVNTRQPMFWMLITLAGSTLAKKNRNI